MSQSDANIFVSVSASAATEAKPAQTVPIPAAPAAPKTVKCTGCGAEKKYSEYSRTQLSRRLSKKKFVDGARGFCKLCVSQKDRVRRYDVTPENLEAMLKANGHKCEMPFCRKPLDNTTAQVDHRHGTKIVRGVLCVNCNTSLGGLHDSPETLLQSVVYLLKTQRDLTPVQKKSIKSSLLKITDWLIDVPLESSGDDDEDDVEVKVIANGHTPDALDKKPAHKAKK